MTDTLSIHDLLLILARLELENDKLRSKVELADGVVNAADALLKAPLFDRNLAKARLKDWVSLYRSVKEG